MNRSIVILGAATLAFGSASAYLYNDLQRTRATTVALQARVDELQKSAGSPAPATADAPAVPLNPFGPPVPGAEAPPPPPRTAAAVVAPPTATFTTIGGGMVGGAAVPMARMAGGWEYRNRMLENPEYREAMKRQQKLMMPRMYPDLQSALHLDEQQAEQFYELLAEQQMNQMNHARPPFAQPGTTPDPNAVREWQQQQQQLRNENEAAIASLLGQDGLQQWKSYQNSLPARSQVRELRATLEGAGVPLRQDQADQLLSVMTAEQKRAAVEAQTAYASGQLANFRSGSQIRAVDRVAMSEQMLERQKQRQQDLRDAVSPILTSQQMRQLERTHASQIEMAEINLKMIRAQAEAEARGELPAQNQMAIGSFIAEH